MTRRAAALVLALSAAASAETLAGERLPPGAASCFGCHAAPRAEGAPSPLDTMSAEAIAQALAAFRSGARAGTVMPRIAKGFSEEESRAIAQALSRPAGSPR